MHDTTLRLLDGHTPASTTDTLTGRPGMFERDDLFLRERLAQLHSSAAGPRDTDGGEGLLDRARRRVGRSFIAVGTAIAGASAGARTTLAEAVAEEDCSDCGVGAAA